MTIEEIEAALRWVDDGCPIPIPEFFRYPGVNFSHEAVRVLLARIKELEAMRVNIPEPGIKDVDGRTVLLSLKISVRELLGVVPIKMLERLEKVIRREEAAIERAKVSGTPDL